MSDNAQRDADVAMIRRHLAELGEHFDTAQIFVTRHMPAEEDGTVTLQMGTGNYYARVGHIGEWMVAQNEFVRMKTRADAD